VAVTDESTAGVERRFPVETGVTGEHVVGPLAAPREAQRLAGQDPCDREAIVGLEHADLIDRDSGHLERLLRRAPRRLEGREVRRCGGQVGNGMAQPDELHGIGLRLADLAEPFLRDDENGGGTVRDLGAVQNVDVVAKRLRVGLHRLVGGEEVLGRVVELLRLRVLSSVRDRLLVPAAHRRPGLLGAVLLFIGAGALRKLRREEVGVPVLPLAREVPGPGQDVGAVDRLHRVLHLDPEREHHVRLLGQDALDRGREREAAGAAGPLDARRRLVLERRIDE
jgi:hypothetical protein